MRVTVNVNGTDHAREIEARLLLVHFLRDELGLTGTHWGCDTSNCGACVVWLDGTPVKSCTVLAAMADGHRVRTVEDLAADGELDPVQRGFTECHGLQCGFCTPGMMLTARWLLDHNPDPSPGEIREALSGQICRCTGYENIVRSVLWASKHSTGSHGPGSHGPGSHGAGSHGPGSHGAGSHGPGSHGAGSHGAHAAERAE
jgi:aerobic carbon-monoxide dehydrogenase small subunit